MQQLGVIAEKGQLDRGAGQLDCADHPVAGVEPDHLPGVATEDLRIDPLHHSLRGAQRESERVAGQGGQAKRPLVGPHGDQLADMGAALQVGHVRRGRDGGQVDGVDLDQPAGAGHQAALAAGGADHRRDDHVVVGPRAVGRQRIRVVRSGQKARRGQQQPAWVVGDLQWRRGDGGGDPARGEQDGAPRRTVLLSDLGQLVADQGPQFLGAVQDRGQLGDLGRQAVPLGLQLDGGEPGQPAQRHLQDVVGLDLGQLEHLDQPRPGLGDVVAAADDRDHVVDVDDRRSADPRPGAAGRRPCSVRTRSAAGSPRSDARGRRSAARGGSGSGAGRRPGRRR